MFSPERRETRAAGFDLSGYYAAPSHADVWPENWHAVVLFLRVQTQWRVGPGGPIGLDYCAVYPLLDRLHPTDADAWTDALDDIRVMESAALDEMRLHQQ